MGYTKTSFKKGNISPMKGKHHTEESKLLMSINRKGKTAREKNYRYGKHCSEELKRKISKSNIGRKWSQEQKDRIKGENHHNWKGDKVKYDALHAWIKRRLKKPSCCDNCRKEKDLDLANISGNYKRDLSDWRWLCRKCHINSDNRINILHKNNIKIKEDALKKWVVISCKNCDKLFKCNPGKHRKFCSRECFYNGYSRPKRLDYL